MWPVFGAYRRSRTAVILLAVLVATACSDGGLRVDAARDHTSSSSSARSSQVDARMELPGRLMGRDWERIPTTRHVVALTFDAGSNAAGVRSILDTLARKQVRATFFLTGDWVRGYPRRAGAIAAAHLVGNHSMTHPHFPDLTNRQIRRQLNRAAAAIRDVCGRSPAPLFRFPFGDRTARTIATVNDSGYVAVRWTVDTLGWKGTRSGVTVRSVVRRVLTNLQPGEIVLMHVGANPDDHSTVDADALPRVIAALRARGFSFVTLSALLTAGS